MANRNRGEIDLRLDKVRTLKFDSNALASFEEEYGKPVLAVFTDMWLKFAKGPRSALSFANVIGIREVRSLLRAGLLHENPRLTVEEAGRLLDQAEGESTFERFAYVAQKLVEAFMASMPTAKKNAEEVLKDYPELAEILRDNPDLDGLGTGRSSNGSPAASADSVPTSSGG